ncbi:MAG TPA: ATP-binding protein [Sphingomicrobium sp.]|jgi:signal transduction histidine kinase/CheY-like chemotaxis protein|nr:ATP-binding protein [Sphingomicrobium sp.]
MRLLRKSVPHWGTAPAAIFIVAIAILAGGLAIILQNESTFREARDRQAMVAAQVLAQSVTAAVDFGDASVAQQAVNAFRVNSQVRYVGVFDRSGRALAAYDPSRTRSVAELAQLPAAPESTYRVSVPIMSAGQRIGTVVYGVEREAVSRRLTRYVILGALAVLAALVIITLGMAQAALRRANEELSERAEALAQSNELLAEQIEERAKAEDQLRQSQKMQALGQLTGGIAHDFNNLLTVIQGSADILSRDELADDRRKRFARAIVQAAENAAVLTSQLLAFARRQPLKPELLNLSELVAGMTDLLDRTMGERIMIETSLGGSCPVTVDRNQLQSAILNVASNARDAMPDGGTLRIRVSVVRTENGEPMSAVAISDSGTGMDSEIASRIFEPFFTTKKTGQGTGLGLSQVYGFATQSGGDVLVESEVGKGTTVTILLPCSEAPLTLGPKADEAAVPSQPRAEILVVEDNEEVGHFAETLLTELGHSVTLATSGEEALELARSHDYDLVFSDVVMPGMGGLRLAEQLAQEKPELPVILATGYSQEIAQSGSGGRPVILKPYRLATLSQALVDAMQGAAANS